MTTAPALTQPACSHPSEWSDDELLSRLLCHDESAWAELVERYRNLIYSCIMKVTSKLAPDLAAVDLDDIYSEVLLGLWRDDMRKLRLYDPSRGTKLSSWIGLLAINTTHDFLRGPARRMVPDVMDESLLEAGQSEPATQSPLEILLDKERWSHLGTVLSSFSDKDRMFLELCYGRGMDAPVIAEHMAISLKTVYSKKHKIRQHLRRCIQNVGKTSAICDLAA